MAIVRAGRTAPSKVSSAKAAPSPKVATAKAAPIRTRPTWWTNLTSAKNAHRTNTKEEFEKALNSGANWFEGDVRKEINSDAIEMRHDKGQERGDNMTLREWLAAGKHSGRSLKLDIKESQHVPEILRQVKQAGIPQDKLMLNLGYDAFERYGAQIRKDFPNAILALNPKTDGKVGRPEAKQLLDQAKRLGGPVTFVLRHNNVTEDGVAELERHGPVSIWGDDVGDVKKRTSELRKLGITGMVDISDHNAGLVNKAKNGLGELIDRASGWF